MRETVGEGYRICVHLNTVMPFDAKGEAMRMHACVGYEKYLDIAAFFLSFSL